VSQFGRLLFPGHNASLAPALVAFSSLYKPLSMPVFDKKRHAPVEGGHKPQKQSKV
jgi:hypothetical protein